MFFPPELAGQAEFEGMGNVTLANLEWARLRELYFSRLAQASADEALDRELARRILERAKRVIAHVPRPTVREVLPFAQMPDGEFSIDDTLEENPEAFLVGTAATAEQLWVEHALERAFGCTLILDCSSSMSGQKHLLASIAVAVMLLQVPADRAGLVVFASESIAVKRPGEPQPAVETILKFLRTRPKGFTNIAKGLEHGYRVAHERARRGGAKRPIALLATDGRATEGGDATEVARRFHSLSVLHLEGPGSDIDASHTLAQTGNGKLIEVENFEDLPRKLYDGLRWLSRR